MRKRLACHKWVSSWQCMRSDPAVLVPGCCSASCWLLRSAAACSQLRLRRILRLSNDSGWPISASACRYNPTCGRDSWITFINYDVAHVCEMPAFHLIPPRRHSCIAVELFGFRWLCITRLINPHSTVIICRLFLQILQDKMLTIQSSQLHVLVLSIIFVQRHPAQKHHRYQKFSQGVSSLSTVTHAAYYPRQAHHEPGSRVACGPHGPRQLEPE